MGALRSLRAVTSPSTVIPIAGEHPSPGAEVGRDAIRLAVVYATDFERLSPGGIASGLKVFARYLAPAFRLVMVGAGRAGDSRPTQGQLEGRATTFIPVVPAQWRPAWLPLNILFVMKLFRARSVILSEADVINPRRMESALPFLLPKSKPVVLTIHGASEHHGKIKRGLLRWRVIRAMYDLVERFVLFRVDRVLLVSEAGYDYYVGRYPQLKAKFTAVPNAVDLAFFAPLARPTARAHYSLPETDLVVVYCGRLSGEKRLDRLLEAFAMVTQDVPAAHLLLAGSGPEEKYLRERASVLGISRARFLGMLTREDVRALLSCADVFALPSSFEGFPNAVLEALSCGVPVVAADVGGVREILTGELQQLVLSKPTPALLKEKILEAARARSVLRPRCIARARDFEASSIMRKLERVYLESLRPVPDGE